MPAPPLTTTEMPSAFLHPFSPPTRASYIELVRGRGALVYDADGREYVDALASLWYCQVGHGRAEIAEAMASQARTLAGFHTFAPFTNGPAEALAERLAALAPMRGARVFFTSSGSEAVDTAIKLVRVARIRAGQPERDVILVRDHAYHGVTCGGTTAQGIVANREGFGPLVPRIVHVAQHDLSELERAFERFEGRVAAVLSEPVQGAGGVHPPAPGYLAGARALCTQDGAWLVHDEVITGFGRLGTWFASSHFGVEPDMVLFAKGVTSGYVPLGGAIVGRAILDALESEPGWVLRHGFTYSGHPTACAAALENLAILERERLLDRAAGLALRFGSGLEALAEAGLIAGFRGVGGIWAARIHEGTSADAVRDRMLALGVMPRPLPGNVVAFCPPLVVTDAQVAQCLDALREAVQSTT